ncbi:hypothetical protein [Aliidiomarina sp.]|uniref:hypothetical protein n=1 Tax=Aliidiomarina sp. TaxID=1872439 RepID=UPI003A4DB5B7
MIKKILPLLLIAAAVMVFMVLSWLGPASNPQTQYRPLIDVSFTFSESDRVQRQVVNDVIYRMQTHHQYRIASSAEDAVAAHVEVEVRRSSEQLILTATIRAANSTSETEQTSRENQTIVVEGPAEVAINLSAKLFSLVNTRLRELAITG